MFSKNENSSSKFNDVLRPSSDSTRVPVRLNSAPNGIPAPVTAPPLSNAAPNPPPIPPGPVGNQVYRAPSGFNAMMPMGRYGMTSGYPQFGSFGYTPGRFGYQSPYMMGEMGEIENSIMRMAEESSRPAFQSIESLVTAVGSISMMLESTYHAVYSSYRAILGVVESFSRLRNHLAHVLSTLALIRTFQWLLQKILHLLRLRKMNPSVEAAWSTATAMNSNIMEGASSHSSWPFVVFLSIVLGAPWLIFRLFSKLAAKKIVNGQLLDNITIHAVALYEFRATHSGELSLRPGQVVTVAPKSQQPKLKGWVMVFLNNQTFGLVPLTYLRFFKKNNENSTGKAKETNITNEESCPAVADEIQRKETV